MTPITDRLREWAQQLETDYGCEHTSDFGEWCNACQEQRVADIREAAALVAALTTTTNEDDLTRQSSPCPPSGTGSPRLQPNSSAQGEKLAGVLAWAKKERDEWDDRNADRYWQMCRVIAQLETAITPPAADARAEGPTTPLDLIVKCPRCEHACGNEIDRERGITIRCQYCGYHAASPAAPGAEDATKPRHCGTGPCLGESFLMDDFVCVRAFGMRMLRAASPAPAAGSAWQDISTAPKDGTEVLMFDEWGRQQVGHWSSDMCAWLAGNTMPKPTHWIPLPAPPRQGTGDATGAQQKGAE